MRSLLLTPAIVLHARKESVSSQHPFKQQPLRVCPFSAYLSAFLLSAILSQRCATTPIFRRGLGTVPLKSFRALPTYRITETKAKLPVPGTCSSPDGLLCSAPIILTETCASGAPHHTILPNLFVNLAWQCQAIRSIRG